MNSRQYCSSWPKWLGWYSLPGAPSRHKPSPLTRLWLLAFMASLSACQAPVHCRPNAQMIDRQARSVIDPGNYLYGIKCQEVLK